MSIRAIHIQGIMDIQIQIRPLVLPLTSTTTRILPRFSILTRTRLHLHQSMDILACHLTHNLPFRLTIIYVLPHVTIRCRTLMRFAL